MNPTHVLHIVHSGNDNYPLKALLQEWTINFHQMFFTDSISPWKKKYMQQFGQSENTHNTWGIIFLYRALGFNFMVSLGYGNF